MQENTGKKIQNLATVILLIGIFLSIIVGVVVLSMDSLMIDSGIKTLYGLLIIIAGSVLSWINYLLLYAFGEITENTTALRQRVDVLAATALEQRKELTSIRECIRTPEHEETNPPPAESDQKHTEREKTAPAEPPVTVHEVVVKRTEPLIVCPNCGTRQASNRSVCFRCGLRFTDIPVEPDPQTPSGDAPNHKGEHVRVDRTMLTLACPLCGERQISNSENCRKCGAVFDDIE